MNLERICLSFHKYYLVLFQKFQPQKSFLYICTKHVKLICKNHTKRRSRKAEASKTKDKVPAENNTKSAGKDIKGNKTKHKRLFTTEQKIKGNLQSVNSYRDNSFRCIPTWPAYC